MRHRLSRAAACLVAALLAGGLGGPATGQPNPPGDAVQVPLQDLPVVDSTGEQLSRWWSDFRENLGFGGRALNLARGYGGEANRSEDFNWLMGVAGFKLKSIDSTVGLLPGLSLEFGQARELSEADREYLERMLERHAQRHPGPFFAVQRMIVAGILEANEIQGFGVEKLTATLLPLPYVKFSLVPVDAPVGQEASRILRAIERLNQRLQEAQGPVTRGRELEVLPPPLLRPAAAPL
jgi:hypothetical protein